MSEEFARQNEYWDREVGAFDAIYSHGKSRFNNWLDATFRWDMYARFDYTIDHAEPIQGRTFLDIGCGTGRYAIEFARRGARQVIGIDIAEKMIEVCRERADAAGLGDRCTFVHSDPLHYQPQTRFDVCIGIGLFDYLREPLPMLAKMREVARDRAIVSLPRLWTWRAPLRKVRLALKGCPVHFYTRERVDALVKEAGFKRYSLEPVGQLHCVTAFVE